MRTIKPYFKGAPFYNAFLRRISFSKSFFGYIRVYKMPEGLRFKPSMEGTCEPVKVASLRQLDLRFWHC